MSLKIRCGKCGSTLLRVVVGDYPQHMDIYCGVCETFLGHLWFNDFIDTDNKPILPETLIKPGAVIDA